jgi:hypothetical protein
MEGMIYMRFYNLVQFRFLQIEQEWTLSIWYKQDDALQAVVGL